ncbi:MAG: hypothetical protein RIQ93_1158, partial [Verrucomicrobiota bacterium]
RKRQAILLRDVFQNTQSLGHNLGSNVVSSENGELKCRHGKGWSVASPAREWQADVCGRSVR